jgi:hypothetical protein
MGNFRGPRQRMSGGGWPGVGDGGVGWEVKGGGWI